jgi:hypothetical protein
LVAVIAFAVPLTANTEPSARQAEEYQGKTVRWWAKHAQQARKDANVRAATIKRLKKTLEYDPNIQESIQLAMLVYPDSGFTFDRAWGIIKHESWMTSDPLHAYNSESVNGCHAVGLYQFLDCTFRSTPYGHMSMYSPYAQSLAAAWMHKVGRGCEWQISPLPTNCR